MDIDTPAPLNPSNAPSNNHPPIPPSTDPRLVHRLPPRSQTIIEPSNASQAPIQVAVPSRSRSSQQGTIQTPQSGTLTTIKDAVPVSGVALGIESPKDASTLDMSQPCPTLQSFIETIVKIYLDRTRKSELEKEVAQNGQQLERSKITRAGIEMLQHMKENGDNELRSINRSLNRRIAHREELADALQKQLVPVQACAFGPNESERIAKVERELNEIKQQLLLKNVSSSSKTAPSQQQKSLASNGVDSAKFSSLEAETVKLKQTIKQLSNSIRKMTDININLRQDQGKLEARVQALEKSNTEGVNGQPASLQRPLPSELESVSRDSKDAKSNSIEALRKADELCGIVFPLKDDLNQLKSLSSSQAVDERRDLVLVLQDRLQKVEAKNTELQVFQQNLMIELRALKEQSKKVEERVNGHTNDPPWQEYILSQLVEKMEKKFGSLEVKFTDLFEGFHQRLGENLKQSPDWIELSGSVSKCLEATQTFTMAIRSLESRYNNINSKTLVMSMADAMQEMYPSAKKLDEHIGVLEEKLGSLTARVDKSDVPEVLTKLPEFQALSGRVTSLEGLQKKQSLEITERLKDITSLKCAIEAQSSEFANLDEHVTEETTRLSDALDQLRFQLESQSEKVGQDITKATSSLMSHTEGHEKFGKLSGDIERSNSQLKKQIEEITNSFKDYRDMLEEFKALDLVGKFKVVCEKFEPWTREINAQLRLLFGRLDESRSAASASSAPQNTSNCAIQQSTNETFVPVVAANAPMDLQTSLGQEDPAHRSAGLHIKGKASLHSSFTGVSTTNGTSSKKRTRQLSLSDDERDSTMSSQGISESSAPPSSNGLSTKQHKKIKKDKKKKEKHKQTHIE